MEKGWTQVYKPYFKIKNNILPPIDKKQKVKFFKIITEKKFTNPPFSFNPSSLLKKMEK